MTTKDIIYMIVGVLTGVFFTAQTWARVREKPSHYTWIKLIGMIMLTLMALVFLIIGLTK
jgi:hypothetical protein